MTDARFPERWLLDRRIMALPAGTFRDYAVSLIWAVGNKTDGRITRGDLMFIPAFEESSIKQLVVSDLWDEISNDTWNIVDFLDTQTSRDQLDALAARRAADRDRKARERARKANESRDMSRDSHAERVRTGQDRPGKDRPGREGDADNVIPLHSQTYVNTTTGEQISRAEYEKKWPEEQNEFQPQEGSAS